MAVEILTFNPYTHAQKSIAWLLEKLIKNGDFVYC